MDLHLWEILPASIQVKHTPIKHRFNTDSQVFLLSMERVRHSKIGLKDLNTLAPNIRLGKECHPSIMTDTKLEHDFLIVRKLLLSHSTY